MDAIDPQRPRRAARVIRHPRSATDKNEEVATMTAPKPYAVKPTAPTAVDHVTQLRASRDRLTQLQREAGEIVGLIRVATIAEDAGRVAALSARASMLPTLIARAAAALLPLEEQALDAEAASIAAQEQAHRAVTDQADRDREAAFEALRAAESAYNITIVQFQTYAIRRQDVVRQRHAIRARLARLATAEEPLPAA